jgi:hypothetical protein
MVYTNLLTRAIDQAALRDTRSANAPDAARGCKMDELIRRKLSIGAGRGSLHRWVRWLVATCGGGRFCFCFCRVAERKGEHRKNL